MNLTVFRYSFGRPYSLLANGQGNQDCLFSTNATPCCLLKQHVGWLVDAGI